MVYYIIALVVIALIYLNVFGMFAGIKNVPEGKYKEQLWRYKKMEILQKGIISIIFAAIIISMNYTQEIAVVSLIGMALILAVELPFRSYICKHLVCPHCGGPVWTGRYFVIIQPRRVCEFCGYHFYDKTPKSLVSEESNEEEQ